jgi:hypothetical protein
MRRERKRDASNDPCVYCASTEPRVGRGHVVPQAFGAFQHNLTLECVCDGCNAYFSRELELSLSRDGAEGFLRLQHGLKSPEASRRLLNRRIASTIQEPGPYFGAHARFGPDLSGESLQPIPLLQVGFRRPTDEQMTWIVEEHLSPLSTEPFRGPGIQIRILANKEEDRLRIVERLRELGINFILQGEFEEPVTNSDSRVWVETTFAVDQMVHRAVAKIAFNYAAKMLTGAFMRRHDFDQAREWIRLGRTGDVPLARVANGKTSIVASVSLFNELTYDIVLSQIFRRLARSCSRAPL